MNNKKNLLLIQPLKIQPPIVPVCFDYIIDEQIMNNFNIKLVDRALYYEKEFISEIVNFKPDVILITLRAVDDATYISKKSFIEELKDVVSLIKNNLNNRNYISIIGGSGYSIFPEAILNETGINIGIRGEGEVVIKDILLKNHEEVKNVKKIIENIIPQNEYEKIIYNRNVINNKYYFDKCGIGIIETKIGCDKNCSFCVEPFIKGNKVRKRNVNNVINEIEVLSKQGIYHIFFADSEFNLDIKHSEDILKEIVKKKINILWSAYIKPFPEFVENKSIIKLMKKSGCEGVIIGAESLSDNIIDNNKFPYKVADVIKLCNLLYKYEIPFSISLLIGCIEETAQTIKETFANLKKIAMTPSVNVMCGVRIYPKTGIYEYEKIKSRNSEQNTCNYLKPIFYNENLIQSEYYPLVKKLCQSEKTYHLPTENGHINITGELKKYYQVAKGPYFLAWQAADNRQREIEQFIKEYNIILCRIICLLEDAVTYKSLDIHVHESIKNIINSIDSEVLEERRKGMKLWIDEFQKIEKKLKYHNFKVAYKAKGKELKVYDDKKLEVEFKSDFESYYNILENNYKEIKKCFNNKKTIKKYFNIRHIVIPIVHFSEENVKIIVFVNILQIIKPCKSSEKKNILGKVIQRRCLSIQALL